MPPLAVVIEEEEILVLDHRAADRASELVDVERLKRNAARVVDPGVGVHVAVAEKLERRAVKRVRAGLGDDVGDRAAGASELGGVAAAVDLELFHRIDAELVRRAAGAGTAEGLAVEIVVVIAAIHLQIVERAAQAAEAEIAGADIARDAGRKQEKRQEIAAVHTQIRYLVIVDRGGDAGARG